MARVAFIGLGTMGLPIARHLVAAGHDVVAHDIDEARAETLGVRAVGSAADAARDAEFAFTSLPEPTSVELVAREIAGAMPAGGGVVDLSTRPPPPPRQLAGEPAAGRGDSLGRPPPRGPTRAGGATP